MRFSYQVHADKMKPKDCSSTFLTANGLGGYASICADGSVRRCDQGILVSAERAPNLRICLVHRLRETLFAGGTAISLSAQQFADDTPRERCHYDTFSFDKTAQWNAEIGSIRIRRFCTAAYEKNSAAVCYQVANRSTEDCVLAVEPMLKMAPKEAARTEPCTFRRTGSQICADGWQLFLRTAGEIADRTPRWELLSYPEDEKDGRPGSGLAGSCCEIRFVIPANSEQRFDIVFSQKPESESGWEILNHQRQRLTELEASCRFSDPTARQLVLAADAYISRRDSTGGKTILAGYPLFSDWGRDTMIALRGCCLSAGRFRDARSILETFLKYEKHGLMPNLFPEGAEAPLYNTADAALLLIDGVWQYYERTGDQELVRRAWPVMKKIIHFYQHGTDHGICMDKDGLIRAGEGFDQVTWMDVRIGEILPTPRHGKPVEINAFWYDALQIMKRFAYLLGQDPEPFRSLSERVRRSFREKFFLSREGYLKDVLSGTRSDLQIRCNQIWAVSMSFGMLTADEEKAVVDTVQRHLFTDHGLRSLSPSDPEYHPHYGGDQLHRDLAYHQGTVWVFPLGAFYLAYLKTHGNSPEAAAQVRIWLGSMEQMLREGCAGQLPEIYDGDCPCEGKGCFAQAWSVGEMLTVYEALEAIEGRHGAEI